MSKAIEKKAPPIAYLLECSDGELGNFELARMTEVANLHSHDSEGADARTSPRITVLRRRETRTFAHL